VDGDSQSDPSAPRQVLPGHRCLGRSYLR
jgi:hypothetical protein